MRYLRETWGRGENFKMMTFSRHVYIYITWTWQATPFGLSSGLNRVPRESSVCMSVCVCVCVCLCVCVGIVKYS